MPVCKRFFLLIASFLLATPALADATATLESAAPKPLPEVHYIDAGGKRETLDPAQAKLTIVHFWATWCIPCVKELPQIDKLAGEYADKGVRVLALALDGADMQHIRNYYAMQGITHLTANYDNNNQTLQAVHGLGLPTSILVDAHGNEIARALGPVDWDSRKTRGFLDGQLK